MASENEVLEQDDVRGRALMRLGIAGVVTATALGALWWLDQDRKPEPPRVDAPAPIVSAPPRAMAPPMTEPEAAQAAEDPKVETGAPVDTAVAPPPAAAVSPAPARQEAPPPPKVSSTPKAPPPPVAAPAQTRPAPPLAAQIAPTGERYVVQLGVFSDPKYAVEMVQKLKRQGVQAHTETRVHLGPFASRAEAEKAQEAMHRLGLQGMVMGATK